MAELVAEKEHVFIENRKLIYQIETKKIRYQSTRIWHNTWQ